MNECNLCYTNCDFLIKCYKCSYNICSSCYRKYDLSTDNSLSCPQCRTKQYPSYKEYLLLLSSNGRLEDIKKLDITHFTTEHLNEAVKNGHTNIVEYFSNNGIIMDNDTLIYAATNGHLKTVEYIISIKSQSKHSIKESIKMSNLNGFKLISEYIKYYA